MFGTFTWLALLAALMLTSLTATAQTPGDGALREVPFSQLTDRHCALLGLAALAIRPADWKHAETPNFVYHFFQSFIAASVAVEAEFYYKVVAAELEKQTAQWERKCHIFIFERTEDWTEFQRKGALDPWTGGMFSGSELFIQRDPARKFKGSTLGHEVTHLVVHRFFGAGVPLWLNEGYAEYASSRGYAAFHRARGYVARPRSTAVDPQRFIGLAELTSAVRYPAEVLQVETFYAESERLVRFLSGIDKPALLGLLEGLGKGNRFDTALAQAFGSRFPSLETLEREFKSYATKDHGVALQN